MIREFLLRFQKVNQGQKFNLKIHLKNEQKNNIINQYILELVVHNLLRPFWDHLSIARNLKIS